ncbi:MAG: serine/threonine-protein phosphatase, partial [Candidatus Delongbacteria bacterium]|nr:serine/threonine-protein phosphatase [Candidatus Delongbacteria bacterium]
DVSGHGVSAALIAMMAKAFFGLSSHPLPGDCLTAINHKLFSVIGDIEYYLTACLCKIDLNLGRIEYASAGHPPAFLWRNGDRSLHVMDSMVGFPLGMMSDTLYQTARLDLIPGDRIVLYTDGILNAANSDRELFQLDSLTDYIKNQSGLTVHQLMHDLVRHLGHFCQGEPPADDQCMMVIDYTGVEKSETQPVLNSEVYAV